MMSASVSDKLTAAERRLAKALRFGADTAKLRAEIALLERQAADDAARVAASNAAKAQARDRNAKRENAGLARRRLEELIASVVASHAVAGVRNALKPDIIAAHRAAIDTRLKSLDAMKAASCFVPAANVADLAKSISALDLRRQEVVDRCAQGEQQPSDDCTLFSLEKDRAEFANLHDTAQQALARAETAETAATKVYEEARQASEALDARIKLIVLVGRQLTLDDQATAVAAQVTTFLGSNTLDQAAAEDGRKMLLRHAQALSAALPAAIGHIDAITLPEMSASRLALANSSPLLPTPDQLLAAQDES